MDRGDKSAQIVGSIVGTQIAKMINGFFYGLGLGSGLLLVAYIAGLL